MTWVIVTAVTLLVLSIVVEAKVLLVLYGAALAVGIVIFCIDRMKR